MVKVAIKTVYEASYQITFLIRKSRSCTSTILSAQLLGEGSKGFMLLHFCRVKIIINGGSRCLGSGVLHQNKMLHHLNTFIFEDWVVDENYEDDFDQLESDDSENSN